MRHSNACVLHAVLLPLFAITILPFVFMVNNAFRDNPEFYHSFFSVPESVNGLCMVGFRYLRGDRRSVTIHNDGIVQEVPRNVAADHYFTQAAAGPRRAWAMLRQYIINSLLVSGTSAIAVAFIASGTAYILARYRFIGREFIHSVILSTLIFPSVLTLVPSFLLIKKLHLLNTYWAMILPYIASGQVAAIFVFKSFFEELPEELFEAARLEGADHLALYWKIVIPLSKPVFAVVTIMNVLGTWNNFLWPFVVNTDGRHHVISSGLYTIATSTLADNYNFNTLYSAYTISSVPLLILFIYATKPFIKGLTSGALKV